MELKGRCLTLSGRYRKFSTSIRSMSYGDMMGNSNVSRSGENVRSRANRVSILRLCRIPGCVADLDLGIRQTGQTGSAKRSRYDSTTSIEAYGCTLSWDQEDSDMNPGFRLCRSKRPSLLGIEGKT